MDYVKIAESWAVERADQLYGGMGSSARNLETWAVEMAEKSIEAGNEFETAAAFEKWLNDKAENYE